ncbi:hypothetical protein [Nocardioides bruguierae]|uniref:Terminase small subunit n=1 Tax=Nocardioides bruguierae TaxID=2945102 RepID=A0A9X2IID4_9ACTN|nr:hypothetical protein [Nocardioides bruguierae]MCM0622705.1 hypothetical protein [Nocardioides bruguierae]
MPKGGARPRSGPAPDPNSGRSEKRGYSPTALPSEGRKGVAPPFPLPRIDRFVTVATEGGKSRQPDKAGTTAFRKRELQVWREVWKTPQAVAWQRDRWRWPTIAEFCRLKVIVETEPEANAALVARLREYRNEIGLSPDGMRANGWAIAVDELEQRTAPKATSAAKSKKAAAEAPAPTRRLRAVGGNGG